MLLAKAQARKGDLASAQAELIALAKSPSSSTDVHTTLGAVYLAKRDLLRARQSFGRALELEPDSVEALAGLIQIDLADKKVADVRARLERRRTSAPRDIRVLLLAGVTFAALGEPRESESMFKRVIQIDPANLGAYDKLARLYLSERRLDEARGQFEEVARREPKSIAATTMVGMILELQNKPDEARKRYEQVLATDPQAAIAANNLAWAYAQNGGNLDLALQLAQTAKSKMPDRHEVNDTLGWIYYKKGLSTPAIASFKQSVSGDPNNAVYWYHLGLAYVQKGDKAEARRSLEQALKLKSNFDGADEARKILQSLQG